MALFSLILLLVANAGFVCLPKGWRLSWKFIESEISFTLQLTEETIEQYNWVGLGFKLKDDPEPQMIGADLINLLLDSDPIDAYALVNGPPLSDIFQGGENDLNREKYNQTQLSFQWNREIDTHDPCDVVLEKFSEIRLLWAAGKTYFGIQSLHEKGDYGTVNITLSDDYESDCPKIIELS